MRVVRQRRRLPLLQTGGVTRHAHRVRHKAASDSRHSCAHDRSRYAGGTLDG
jgi:hypothetical protein